MLTSGLLGLATRILLGHRLAHQSEGALLGDVAESSEVLDGLLAGSMLLARDDAALVLHQVLLDEATRGVLGSSVKYLGL